MSILSFVRFIQDFPHSGKYTSRCNLLSSPLQCHSDGCLDVRPWGGKFHNKYHNFIIFINYCTLDHFFLNLKIMPLLIIWTCKMKHSFELASNVIPRVIPQSVSQFNLWGLIWDVSCFVCGLLWPAIICYFATFATGQIASLGSIAFETNWYEYPTVLQKYTIFIIMRSNESVHFTGFGLVPCTLEKLKEVWKPFKVDQTYFQIFFY